MNNPTPDHTEFEQEQARSDWYGIFAALFYTGPWSELLAKLRAARVEPTHTGGSLGSAWLDLVKMSQDMSDAQVSVEYDALFGGVGQPEVHLLSSYFLSGFLNEKPLVQLRDDLRALEITRDPVQMSETEDHVSFLCEVMRHLISLESSGALTLKAQERFFSDHLFSWCLRLCETIVAHPRAHFYAALAHLFHAFLLVERQGFDIAAQE